MTIARVRVGVSEWTTYGWISWTQRQKKCLPLQIFHIAKVFREADADGTGGLDMEEFCAMKQLYVTVNSTPVLNTPLRLGD